MITFLAACIIGACGGSAEQPQLVAAEGLTAHGAPRSKNSRSTPIREEVVTRVEVESIEGHTANQTQVPLTFGQVFGPGDIPANTSVSMSLDDGSAIPFQVDVKARHADGSLRHAVLSAALPHLGAGKSQTILLSKTAAVAKSVAATTPNDLLSDGFQASVNLDIGGTLYSASADQLVKSAKHTAWLAGAVVTEWLVSAPLKTAAGVEHPHLSARFAIRSYAGLKKARVDVTIENNWAYEPGPQNFTYDAEIVVGQQSVYEKKALTHFHHARWRKVFWWGDTPQVDVKPDMTYLMASKAVPNYDSSIRISEAGLKKLEKRWTAADTKPMGAGIVAWAMPMAGGRGDIGPLPQWAAMYLLSADPRTKEVTLGVGDLAGSWPIHYRDKATDHPVSLDDYPYMTLLGHPPDTLNPTTRKREQFPKCGGDCTTTPKYKPDAAHQPSLAYLPYLITGDYFYLEELHFWANWNMLRANPGYRGAAKGLLQWDEVRGQAWSMRTLGQAAYITPDGTVAKKYFSDRLTANLDWYTDTYARKKPNSLGVLDGSGAHGFPPIAYSGPAGVKTGLAPWQDDFFTWSIGYLFDLGYLTAKPLLQWKAQFPVGRMVTAGFCWVDGAAYTLTVRASASSSLYGTLAEAYQATLKNKDGTPLINSSGTHYIETPCGSEAQADWRTQRDKDNKVARSPWRPGEMDGYAADAQGYPSNMQPALAVAATSGIPGAKAAWRKFIERSVKPDYSAAPQWGVVPSN